MTDADPELILDTIVDYTDDQRAAREGIIALIEASKRDFQRQIEPWLKELGKISRHPHHAGPSSGRARPLTAAKMRP